MSLSDSAHSGTPCNSFSLYIARFERFQPQDHVGLFVLTETNAEGRPECGEGILHHVTDDPIQSVKARVKMSYHVVENFVPSKTPFPLSFKQLDLIGTMPCEKMETLVFVCENMPEPSFPRKTKRPPRCNAWLDNVICELCSQGVTHASASFVVPPKKVGAGLRERQSCENVMHLGNGTEAESYSIKVKPCQQCFIPHMSHYSFPFVAECRKKSLGPERRRELAYLRSSVQNFTCSHYERSGLPAAEWGQTHGSTAGIETGVNL